MEKSKYLRVVFEFTKRNQVVLVQGFFMHFAFHFKFTVQLIIDFCRYETGAIISIIISFTVLKFSLEIKLGIF